MTRPGWRKIVALVTTVVGMGALSATAANATYTTDCTSNYMCLYNQASFQARIEHRYSGFGQTNITDYGQMTSWENHSSRAGAWYDGPVGAFGNDCFDMNAYTVNGNVGPLYNDSAVSWRGNGSC